MTNQTNQYSKRLIEVDLPIKRSRITRGARNRSGTDTSRLCTFGGHGARWLPVAPCCVLRCGPIRQTPAAPKSFAMTPAD